jgi:hypothetical protein
MPFKGLDGKTFLTVVVKGTFAIPDRGVALLAQEQLPVEYGDIPHNGQDGGSTRLEADVAPFKPRADIVLVGHAYAPPGKLVAAIDVSLRVGRLQKVLRVFGNRTWKCASLSGDHLTDPEPFDKMPIVYERAFGGIDLNGGGYLPSNLAGCGYFAKISKKSVHNAPLPNIEDPTDLIRSPKDRPRPMGYGFWGRAWEPRLGYLGTYDEEYRKRYYPNLPPDFKYDYYNGAHPDLQVKGYLRGDEPVELINLSPHGTLNFQLPAQQLACRVDKTYETLQAYIRTLDDRQISRDRLNNTEPVSEQIAMNLDTLCLLPDEKRFFLVWRGSTPVYDHTALEVETLTVG